MSSQDTDGKPIVKIDKWDGSAVKNALDDAAKDVFISDFAYVENTWLIDLRLWICTLACAVANLALAYDYYFPFPASRGVLVACVTVYFAFMVLLTLYTNYYERNIFCVCEDKDPAGLDPAVKWRLSSHLKRFDDMYSISIEVQDAPGKMWREASFSRSVANFFDENGVLVSDVFEKEVRKLHDSLGKDRKRK